MFSKGQLVFALLFFISFVVIISWAYAKDKGYNKFYFKGSYKVLLFMFFVLITLYGIVKVKRLFFP